MFIHHHAPKIIELNYSLRGRDSRTNDVRAATNTMRIEDQRRLGTMRIVHHGEKSSSMLVEAVTVLQQQQPWHGPAATGCPWLGDSLEVPPRTSRASDQWRPLSSLRPAAHCGHHGGQCRHYTLALTYYNTTPIYTLYYNRTRTEYWT